MSLRLLSYNIRYGGTGREEALAGVISACGPEVVLLQEAYDPGVVERLAQACRMPWWGATRGDSVAYLSRIEVTGHSWHALRFGRRRYLELALAGQEGPLFGVHLSAIHSNLTEQRRTYEIRSLLHDLSTVANGFHIVTGDFNTLAPGEQLDLRRLPLRLRAVVWMTGRNIRWRVIRMMLDAGYIDSFRLLHKDAPGYSFPTWDPNIRLDYAFVPAAYVARVRRCDVVREVPLLREASDHFPLLTEIE